MSCIIEETKKNICILNQYGGALLLFSVHRKKISPKSLVMRRKQNENNENYLPDKNSFAALFTFEVETFQRVKLFNLTTKLVVKHFRN